MRRLRENVIRRAAITSGVALAALTLGAGPASAGTSGVTLSPTTQFSVVAPQDGARLQIAQLTASGDKADAALLRDMIRTPQAFWVNGGVSDMQTQQTVKQVVQQAAGKGQMPVFVLYNIPFRDCAQFSAGGASTPAQYASFVQAVAAGLGSQPAMVMLEPDSLGIIPWNTDINGNAEWCKPTVGASPAPGADPATRYAELGNAVTTLKTDVNAKVYLDGTHSGWLGVGDASDRLMKGGVAHADGFFLNVSNYQYTPNLVQYGTWISKCITTGAPAGCPNQYWNGGPDGTAIASLIGAWNGVALSNYGVWSDSSTVPALNTSGINARLGGVVGTTHFVIDTSRNGLGPWDPTTAGWTRNAGGSYSPTDPQDWCNPPNRGAGIQTTAATGNALVDAYLWVKTNGTSDGPCNRGVAGSTTDPEWGGIVDPAAGLLFPQMALQLARNAVPALHDPSAG